MASAWVWYSAVLLLVMYVTALSPYKRRYNTYSRESNYYYPLPQTVKPTSYAVTLNPSFNEGRYNGSVEISIICQEPTSMITMHAHEEINITHSQITNEDKSIEITGISKNASNGTISLSVNEELQSGITYKLLFEFHGSLQTNDGQFGQAYPAPPAEYGGFFLTSVREIPGITKQSWFAGITMYHRSLRKVFPCFDDPSFKATFKISVGHWSNMTALSVMPIESSEIYDSDLVMDNFEETPPLSTSSISVLIFETEIIKNTLNLTSTSESYSIYVHHRQESYMNRLSLFQKNTSTRLLEYIEDYLDVPYPLPKLDIVGVSDLHYETSSSILGLIAMQEYVVNGYTNDLANQWFKHITTPEKWELFNISDILTDYIMTDAIRKLGIKNNEYQVQKSDLYSMFYYTPYQGTYWNPYNVVRGRWFFEMLNSSLTEKTMQTALGNLVRNNLYGTYTPEKLWEEITKQSHADGTLSESIRVQDIANSWMNSNRFPVLSVTRNYNDNTAKLQQHIYNNNSSRHFNGNNLTESERGMLWSIPIIYITNGMESMTLQPVTWMTDKEMVISNVPDANSFIIINPTDSGMFLVNYDIQNWQLLSDSLLSPDKIIPAETRRKLVQDSMLLVSAEELSVVTALNLTMFLFNETDYAVWMPFLQYINSLDQITVYMSLTPKLHTYIRLLLSPMINSSTPPDPSKYSQGYINFWYQGKALLERVGYQPFINETQQRLNDTLPLTSFYDNDTDLIMFCPQNSENDSDWSTYALHVQQFTYMPNSFLQKSICKCPGYLDHVKRQLDKILDDESTFQSYEFYQIIHFITICKESQEITFNFFLNHFNEFRQRYYYVKDVWNTLLNGILSKVRTEDQLTRLTQFYEENEKKFGYSNSTVQSEIKRIKADIANKNIKIQEIEEWLDYALPFIQTHSMS